jgi:hypothetical protein
LELCAYDGNQPFRHPRNTGVFVSPPNRVRPHTARVAEPGAKRYNHEFDFKAHDLMSDANKKKARKLLLWTAFSVAFALGPLFVNFLLVRDDPQFEWQKLANRGELFLIATALSADGIGRVWNQRAVNGFYGTVVLVACVFILFTTSAEFGIVAPKLDVGTRLALNQVRDSVVVFGCAVVTGFAAVLIEE